MKIFVAVFALFAASLVQSSTLLEDFNAKYDLELTESFAAHATLVNKVIARYASTAKAVKKYQSKVFERLLRIPTVPRTIAGDFKRRHKNLKNKMSYEAIRNVFLIPAQDKIDAVRARVESYNSFSSNPKDICYKLTDFKGIWDNEEYLVQLTLISREFDSELIKIEERIEALIVDNERIFVTCKYSWTCISAVVK